MRWGILVVVLALAGCAAYEERRVARYPAPCSEHPLAMCGGQCVVVDEDPDHCGACDRACPEGQICHYGTCRSPFENGQTRCGDNFADVDTDPDNCGMCGNVCPETRVCGNGGGVRLCTDGVCAHSCAGDMCHCAGEGCVDLDHDPDNCGACGNRCDSDKLCPDAIAFCKGGKCETSLTDCGGTCVDVTTSPNHCAACGCDCTALGLFCIAGKCTDICSPRAPSACSSGESLPNCPSPYIICTDTQTDPDHCGVCDNACLTGQTCVSGLCE